MEQMTFFIPQLYEEAPHGVLEAHLPLGTWLGHDPGEEIYMYCQLQKGRACP